MSRTSVELLREMAQLYRTHGSLSVDDQARLQHLLAVAEAEDAALSSGQRPSGSVVHRAIRNYLVNELKFTGERVGEIVCEVARERVTAWLNSTVAYNGREWSVGAWLANLVRAAVRDHVAEQVRRDLARVSVTVEIKP